MSIKAFVSEYTYLSNVLINTVTVNYNNVEINENALWDTGATRTCISNEVVKSLNLIPIGKIDMIGSSGYFTSDTFLLNITLPNDISVANIVVQETEIGAAGIGLLIGMDIITLGDFSVSNYNGKTVFTFRTPSQERIDYIK